MQNKYKKHHLFLFFPGKMLAVFLLLAISWQTNLFAFEKKALAASDEVVDDYALYQKYSLYLKYQKGQQYLGYKKFTKVKKYGFKKEAQRAQYQSLHDNYQLYQADPVANAVYKKNKKAFVRYENYLKKYLPLAQYAPYKSYKAYNKKKFNAGAAYGGQEYLDGYNRYLAAQGGADNPIGEADLGGGSLGPDISIGLHSYSRTALQNEAFKITAKSATTGNALDYVIKDSAGTILATVAGDKTTKVNYVSNKNFTVFNSLDVPITVNSEIRFEAADPAKSTDIVFDFNRPASDFDQYRGSVILKYYNNPAGSDEVWAINKLPIEHYVWGMGEITGTGPSQHNNVMTTVFRTYGYWKIKFSTKYAGQGFVVNATPGNQLYYGYQWEKSYPNIRIGAETTRGKLVMYRTSATKNELALTPYSSWTDGRTRSFQERWGSNDYPWCRSVKDPYGKHPSLKTAELEDAGNHMVGLSAHGSLALAGDKYKWSWDRILKYYFTGINLLQAY